MRSAVYHQRPPSPPPILGEGEHPVDDKFLIEVCIKKYIQYHRLWPVISFLK